jgi:uncharacterized membrane protein YcaP (DUF421 family)
MDAVLRGLAIYFTLLVIIRLSGRRTLSQMTPFDLVIVLVISETTQQAMLGDDFSITNAIILILTLFTTNIGLSYVKRWWPRAAHVVDGVPTILVTDGDARSRDPGFRKRTLWKRLEARMASKAWRK